MARIRKITFCRPPDPKLCDSGFIYNINDLDQASRFLCRGRWTSWFHESRICEYEAWEAGYKSVSRSVGA